MPVKAFLETQIIQLKLLFSAAVQSGHVDSQQPPAWVECPLLSPATPPPRQTHLTAIQSGIQPTINTSTGSVYHGVSPTSALDPNPLLPNLFITTGTSVLAHNPPALLQKILQQISKHEYIDFSELLSDNLYPHPSLTAQNQFKLQINAQDPLPLVVVPSQQCKCRVDGIHSWLEA